MRLLLVVASAAAAAALFERSTLASWDGTLLKLKIHERTEEASAPSKTVVILPNSWAMPSVEYHVPMATYLAEFRSVEYETRGFYLSGGSVGMAGPEDVEDAKAVIDFAFRRWPETQEVVLCGVSYGGGLALLAAASDSRVTAVVAYSAWPSLYDSLNPNDSPNRYWATLLLGLGAVTGNLTADVFEIWNDVRAHANTSYVREWSALRDPSSHPLKVPVLLLSNLDDGLFFSQHTFHFWQQLERASLVFGYGTHAQSETPGMLGLEVDPRGPWHRAADWIRGDRRQETSVTFLRVENHHGGDSHLEFNPWPPSELRYVDLAVVNEKAPRGTVLHYGPSHVGSGELPILEEVLKPVTSLPVANLALAALESTSLVFFFDRLDTAVTVLGVPELRGLRVVPHQASFQLYAYLYAVGETTDLARLVTSVPFTAWNATPGVAYDIPALSFAAAAFRVPEGHRLALAFNMHNKLFVPATDQTTASLDFLVDESSGLLRVPLLVGGDDDRGVGGGVSSS